MGFLPCAFCWVFWIHHVINSLRAETARTVLGDSSRGSHCGLLREHCGTWPLGLGTEAVVSPGISLPAGDVTCRPSDPPKGPAEQASWLVPPAGPGWPVASQAPQQDGAGDHPSPHRSMALQGPGRPSSPGAPVPLTIRLPSSRSPGPAVLASPQAPPRGLLAPPFWYFQGEGARKGPQPDVVAGETPGVREGCSKR